MLHRELLNFRLCVSFNVSQSIRKQGANVSDLLFTICEIAQIKADYPSLGITDKKYTRRMACIEPNFTNSFNPCQNLK